METSQIVAIAAFIAIILFEALFPFRHYTHRIRHFGKNAIFSLANTVLLSLFGAFINIGIFMWIEKHDIGLLNQTALPFWAKALIASVIFDGWMYFWHRINHITPFLWRFHQVHHSDLEMDMSTALRFHPGEILLSSIANIAIYVSIGISLEMIVIYKIVFNINVLFHHSNLSLPEKWDRPIRGVLVSPNMHRVHHSQERPETNSNYSSLLSIWDRIFGTYRKRPPSEISFGLDYDRDAESQELKNLLTRPFRKR